MQTEIAERLAGLPVSVKASPNGTLPPPQRRGKVIVILSPKGGSGKTAVASNLAVALAQQFPGRVAALDLDVQFGDMCISMGLRPEHNLAEAAQSSVDATTIKLFLTPYADASLYVMCGARTPAEADKVTHQHVSTIIPLLAQDFDYVVVDTPAGLDERTLSALELATDLFLVSSLDVTSIRSLRKAVDAMDVIGVKAERYFILNRSDANVGLRPQDVVEAVGLPIVAQIPSARQIPFSMNVGTPIVRLEPKSAVAKQLSQLTRLVTPTIDIDKPKRRLFRRSGR
jgi:pilus assembly protein CpaE